MARGRKKRWIRDVKTVSTFPPEGLFKKDAEGIARTMASRKVSRKGISSAISMIQYFINRAGKNLPPAIAMPYRPSWIAKISVSAAALVFLSGCGTLWPSFIGPSPSSPERVFECALNDARSRGYSPIWIATDAEPHGFRVSKNMPTGRRDWREIKRFDYLQATVIDDRTNGSTLIVRALTTSRLWTRVGYIDRDEYASQDVERDARQIAEHCGWEDRVRRVD